MEKPDANGYVNIYWPSKNVPHGGVFHPKTVESTQEQQKFLKGNFIVVDELLACPIGRVI